MLARDPRQHAPLALLLGLELLPVAQHLVGVLRRQVAEDVRVPVDELVDDALDDVVDGEAALASRELRLEDHLEQQIPQLLAQGGAVCRSRWRR